MTRLQAIIVYILMVERVVTLSLPEPDSTAEKFRELLDPKTERICTFPPAIALVEDNLGLCVENDNQKNRPIAKSVCDDILELTDNVCGLQNFSISVSDVIENFEVSRADLCSHAEIQHVITKEECPDFVQTEQAFHLVRLYSAMLKGLFNTFAGTKNLTTLHSILQRLPKYFPFPPKRSEDRGSFLQKCENDDIQEPTHGLCLHIRDLATEYASNYWIGQFYWVQMYLNVSEGTWDPCPVLAEWNEFFKDKCDVICGAENVVICRSLAYGYLKKPNQDVARTETFPSHTDKADPTINYTEGPKGNQNVSSKPEDISTVSPHKTTVSPDPNKTPTVILDSTKMPKGSSFSTEAIEITPVSSKANDVIAVKNVSSTIPSTEFASSTGTIPDGNTTETKDQVILISSGGIDKENNASQTHTSNGNDSLTSKATLLPSTTMSTDQDTSPDVALNFSTAINVWNDDEDNDKADIGKETGKLYENSKPDSKTLDSQITQDDTGGISFMSYFLVFVVLCVAGYILFHNKQKIIALVIEGKNTQHGRRPSSKDYNRLKTDDVMPSLEKSASSSNYVY